MNGETTEDCPDTGDVTERPATEPRPSTADSPAMSPSGFGHRGWLLVAAVVLSVAVVPGMIYLLPGLPANAGLPFLAAMIALPMAPALLLGLVAVWSITAAS